MNFMKHILLLFLWTLPVAAFSQSDTALVKLKNPEGVLLPKGYSQVAEINLGTCRMLIISGQVALDKQGNITGKNDLAGQTEQVFANIKSIVEDAGGTLKDIVKLGVYMLDVSQVQVFRNIRDRYINLQQPPTSTLVQVSGLVRKELLIEIEATAILPVKK